MSSIKKMFSCSVKHALPDMEVCAVKDSVSSSVIRAKNEINSTNRASATPVLFVADKSKIMEEKGATIQADVMIVVDEEVTSDSESGITEPSVDIKAADTADVLTDSKDEVITDVEDTAALTDTQDTVAMTDAQDAVDTTDTQGAVDLVAASVADDIAEYVSVCV
jgi:hypothetical protein